MPEVAQPPTRPTGWLWAAAALGFAMGGFFDGILLHQILQWHHLLSGVEAARQDLRAQIMADGLFHLAMYLVAALGLVLLWRARREATRPGAGRSFIAVGLLGFGLWHVVDAIASHWLLGLHRIRQNAPDPLLWDLLWLGAFGLVPLAIAAVLLARRKPASRLHCPPWAVAAAVMVAGAGTAAPPADDSTAIVVFRPGLTAPEALGTILSTDTRLLWTDASGSVWALDMSDGTSAWDLYRGGALMVGRGWFAGACLNWTIATR